MSGGTADGVSDAGEGGDRVDVLPYVYRVTKYDPADRDERGHYVGAEDIYSDHGRVEACYLAVVAAFAEDSALSTVMIREPEVVGVAHFGVEPPVDGYGLAGLFPADLSGYHDGAEIPLAVAAELVRVMLRDNGAWCRLEVEDRFFVHVGYDQYLYIGSVLPCRRAVGLAHDYGLFAERITQSPYTYGLGDEPSAVPRAADTAFWSQVHFAHHRARGRPARGRPPAERLPLASTHHRQPRHRTSRVDVPIAAADLARPSTRRPRGSRRPTR
jgi:hypothetical protein